MPRFLFIPFVLIVLVATAAAQPVPSYKDGLFAYRILAVLDGGDRLVVDYDEMADINGRDRVPERQVRSDYLDRTVRGRQTRRSLAGPNGPIPLIATGAEEDASVITVFLHGQGGNEMLGSDDGTFGGNFNHIKSLMVRSGGLYLTPTFTDFGEKGASEVAAVIRHYSDLSPGAPVLLACGSMGGALCTILADHADVASRLGGVVLLATSALQDIVNSRAVRHGVPVTIAHGSRDPVFPLGRAEALYRALRQNGRSAHLIEFRSGNHGTPIRMIDWRETMAWTYAHPPAAVGRGG